MGFYTEKLFSSQQAILFPHTDSCPASESSWDYCPKEVPFCLVSPGPDHWMGTSALARVTSAFHQLMKISECLSLREPSMQKLKRSAKRML